MGYRQAAAAAFVAGFCAAAAGAANPLERDFEAWAARIPVFDFEGIVFDAEPSVTGCGARCDEAIGFYRYLKSKRLDPVALKELLAHANPKVRTLGLAALYDREEPRWLPDLHALISDRAATFPAVARFHLRPGDPPPPLTPQAVGDVATLFVRRYLEAAGYHGWAVRTPGFSEYWQEHRTRAYSANWFAVQLSRAGQSTSPTATDRLGHIRRVRERIDALPDQADRAWTLLALRGNTGWEALVTDDELVLALNALGRPALLRLLRKEALSTDPAFAARQLNNTRFERMCAFVRLHAGRLPLLAEDAILILSSAGKEITTP